jgi:hypothetical protein
MYIFIKKGNSRVGKTIPSYNTSQIIPYLTQDYIDNEHLDHFH